MTPYDSVNIQQTAHDSIQRVSEDKSISSFCRTFVIEKPQYLSLSLFPLLCEL